MDRIVLDRLFIAVPELGQSDTFLKQLLDKGIINRWQVDLFKALRSRHPMVRPLTGRTLLTRIAMIAPELLSTDLLDGLQVMRLVSTKDAHILKVLFRSASRLIPGQVKNETIWTRMGLVFDDVFSPDLVNYIRAVDNESIDALAAIMRRFPENFGLRENIFGHRFGTLTSGDGALIRQMLEKSVARAQILRSIISTGRTIRPGLASLRAADGVWDVLTLAFDDLLSEKLLRNMVRAGVISPERFALANSLRELGAGVWRKIAVAHTYEGWAARSLLMSEGILSPETVRLLVALGRISPEQAAVLYPVVAAIRGVTRTFGARWRTSQRYRIVPGEKPIATFARMTVQTDSSIMRLLAEAARDAGREAERLASAKTFGKLTRAAQQRTVANAMHRSMRDMMENTGSMIIFGEKEAAQAALESFTFMARPYGANTADLQRMLRLTAQSGVDSFISREENLRQLSRRVYGNLALLRGQVDREIAKGLLRGLSSRELAATMERFISPTTPGGSSYAAMRLARTEINNAFHFTQIRFTREMPWVDGYRWHLSGAHKRPDVCNDMNNHVYAKNDVPGKPHPQCLCFITTETADSKTFYSRYRSGAYDRYVESVQQGGVFNEDTFTPIGARGIARSVGTMALLTVLSNVAGAASKQLLG